MMTYTAASKVGKGRIERPLESHLAILSTRSDACTSRSLPLVFVAGHFYYVKRYEVKRIANSIQLTFIFYSNKEKEAIDKQIEEKVEAVYRTMDIDHSRSDLEVEKAVNDWLVKNGKWDDEDSGPKAYDRRYSVLGILLDGRGVCLSVLRSSG